MEEERKSHNYFNLSAKRAIAEGDEQFNQNKRSRIGDVHQSDENEIMQIENFDHNDQMEVIDYVDFSKDQRMITDKGAADAMWETFLPPDYREIIAETASFPLLSSLSTKDLYFHLCHNPILLDNGTMSFALDKQSGKKCYMIGSRALSITWGDMPSYWTWMPLPESRFNEVAVLRIVWWLDARCRIQTNILSPKTTYAAYLVFKFAEFRRGFKERMAELGVIFEQTGAHERRTVYLDPPEGMPQPCRDRGDGWMEIEMGSFFNDNGDGGTAICCLREVDNFNPKQGLIVEGVEFRPKDVVNS